MATRSISITYPDAAGARIVAALRAQYGQVEDPAASGTFRDRTAAEVFALFEADIRASLRDIVRKYERDVAAKAAADAVADVSVTG